MTDPRPNDDLVARIDALATAPRIIKIQAAVAIDRDRDRAATRDTVGDIAVGAWRFSYSGQVIEIAAPTVDDTDDTDDAHPATYSGTYVVEVGVIDDHRSDDFARLFHVIHNGKRYHQAFHTAEVATLAAFATRAGDSDPAVAASYAARVLGITDAPTGGQR